MPNGHSMLTPEFMERVKKFPPELALAYRCIRVLEQRVEELTSELDRHQHTNTVGLVNKLEDDVLVLNAQMAKLLEDTPNA